MVGRSAPFLCTKSGAGSSFNIGAHLAFRFIIGQRTGELRTDERQKVKFLFSLFTLSLYSLSSHNGADAWQKPETVRE